MFLKVSQEDIGAGVFFNKVASLKAYNFIKSRLQHSCFPVNFCKFLKTLNLKNICEWLFLPSWRHRFLYNNIINCYRSTSPHYSKKLNKNCFKALKLCHMILKIIQQIIQMFDKIQMILMMKTSISKNHISRLN